MKTLSEFFDALPEQARDDWCSRERSARARHLTSTTAGNGEQYAGSSTEGILSVEEVGLGPEQWGGTEMASLVPFGVMWPATAELKASTVAAVRLDRSDDENVFGEAVRVSCHSPLGNSFEARQGTA